MSAAPLLLIDARVNAMPGAHGLARSVLQLAVGAAACDGDGARLAVLACSGRPQLFSMGELARGAELIETPVAIGALHRSAQLAAQIARTGAGVLYAPYPLFAPLICPCPLVTTVHDVTMELDARFAGGWHRQAGLKLVTGAVLRRAAAVTAPSQAAIAGIHAVYPRAGRPALVPNGVDAARFAHAGPAEISRARSLYRLPEQFVLAVGAHRPHKNFAVLVAALAALPGDLSLVVLGQRDPRFPGLPAQLAELAARAGVAARTVLVDQVDEGLLPAVYRAARVVAVPSLAEGYGLPALEALAAGVPLVTSDIPVLAEVCGDAALAVPASDPAAWAAAISSVLTDPAAASARVKAGAAVAAAASWRRGGAALRRLLLSVVTSLPEGEAKTQHGSAADQ